MDTDTREKLSCQEVVGLVTDYLEHALLPPTRDLLEQHLDDCPGCATYVQQIQQTIGMLRMLANDAPFPETRDHLIALFQQWKQSAPQGFKPFQPDDSTSQT